MIKLYSFVTYLFYPLIALYLAFRKAKGKEDLSRFSERMGYASRPRPEGRLVWIHGASVGETLSMLPLIERIQKDNPEIHILVTSGTITSAQMMEKRLTGTAFHQYMPIDCMPQVTRFVNHWKPDVVFWLESEFWPNVLSVLKNKEIPVVLLNGRVSDKSFERWKKHFRFSRSLQSLFSQSFGQTTEDERRLKELGAKNTACVGNIKFASPALPVDEKELSLLKKKIGNRPCWVVASTHAGEEEIIARVSKKLKEAIPELLTVIAPRHPNRREEVTNIFTKEGLFVSKRSVKEELTVQTDVYLGDTIGEMGLYYRLGDIAFVGGSLIKFGGQNMIEPARLGRAVISGIYTMNFREVVERATKAEALSIIENEQELYEEVSRLFANPELLHKRQEKAEAFAREESDVLERLMPLLSPYLTSKK